MNEKNEVAKGTSLLTGERPKLGGQNREIVTGSHSVQNANPFRIPGRGMDNSPSCSAVRALANIFFGKVR